MTFGSPIAPRLALVSALVLAACNGGAAQQGYQPAPASGPQPATDSSADGEGYGKDGASDPGDANQSKAKTKKPVTTDGGTDEKEPDTPPPDPNAGGSGGKGGGTGLVEVAYTSGLVSSSYKINAPADAATGKLYGLHIHFHGDGGGGYRDFPNKALRDGLIGVTVKAPNQNLQWWVGQPAAYADYANALIQNELLKKYNIDPKRIYFSGVSGGSYFLAGNFLPKYGQTYATSGAFLMCGGQTPASSFAQPAFLKTFRLHWQITGGERDDIVGDVQGAIRAYEAALRGAGVQDTSALQTSNVDGSGGHCEFFGLDYTGGIQAMIDRHFHDIVK
jgi:hypothetical protein